MLCLMHDGEPYGHLRSGGADIEPPELARATGFTPTEAKRAIQELERAGVFSRTSSGTIYSRRSLAGLGETRSCLTKMHEICLSKRKSKSQPLQFAVCSLHLHNTPIPNYGMGALRDGDIQSRPSQNSSGKPFGRGMKPAAGCGKAADYPSHWRAAKGIGC
jgi:hypothetical protein